VFMGISVYVRLTKICDLSLNSVSLYIEFLVVELSLRQRLILYMF